MVSNMMDIGKMIKRMARVYAISMIMNTMMVTGLMIIKMDMENMLRHLGIIIKANGSMMKKMGKVKKNILMELNTLDII